MQSVQKRVAAEVKLCLNEYALNNDGRYPWAVLLTDLTNYDDNTDQLFGRIPDDMGNTRSDSGNDMDDRWGANCNTHENNTASTWWESWREMVFYGLADAYKPVDPSTTLTTCPACLIVNPPSATADKKFVVIVAGKMLASQLLRNTNKTNATFYLEGGNQNADQTGSYSFTQGAPSATFNDTIVFQ